MFGEPKRLMPNFPRKQGKYFRLNLGQDVSDISIEFTMCRRVHSKIQD
jgi:hypothetical protein